MCKSIDEKENRENRENKLTSLLRDKYQHQHRFSQYVDLISASIAASDTFDSNLNQSENTDTNIINISTIIPTHDDIEYEYQYDQYEYMKLKIENEKLNKLLEERERKIQYFIDKRENDLQKKREYARERNMQKKEAKKLQKQLQKQKEKEIISFNNNHNDQNDNNVQTDHRMKDSELKRILSKTISETISSLALSIPSISGSHSHSHSHSLSHASSSRPLNIGDGDDHVFGEMKRTSIKSRINNNKNNQDKNKKFYSPYTDEERKKRTMYQNNYRQRNEKLTKFDNHQLIQRPHSIHTDQSGQSKN